MNSFIQISPELRNKIRLAVFQAEGVTVAGKSGALEKDLAELTTRIAERYASPADAISLFTPTRTLYKSIGLDPTRTRPSSESLIRRVIKGTGLYRINRVVDTCNLCSIDFALSIGLYDSEQVRWPATLRLGVSGEGYKGLGKDHVNVSGRMTLADSKGPFGNPSSDSERTRIRDETTALTIVIYTPAGYETAKLEKQLKLAGERLVTYAGGSIVFSDLL